MAELSDRAARLLAAARERIRTGEIARAEMLDHLDRTAARARDREHRQDAAAVLERLQEDEANG